MTARCDAWTVEHDCTAAGACSRALLVMTERMNAREAVDHAERMERVRPGSVELVWPDDPRWAPPVPADRKAAA